MTVEEKRARKALYNKTYREKHAAELKEKRHAEQEKKQQEKRQLTAYTALPFYSCVVAEAIYKTTHAVVMHRPFEPSEASYIAVVVRGNTISQAVFGTQEEATAFLKRKRVSVKKSILYRDFSQEFMTEYEERK